MLTSTLSLSPAGPALPPLQLIYLLKHPKSYIHSIFGSHEPLLFVNGLEKLILSVDLTASAITFVSKPQMLASLGHLSEDQFLDAGLLAGSELAPAFPPLAAAPAGLRAVADAVKQLKSGSDVVRAYLHDAQLKELGYPDLFVRARSAVRYALVLTAEEGRATPLPLALAHENSLTAADVPQDLHELFSHRLPDEVYFHVCRGLVSPQLVGWLTTGLLVEHPPLDNGESTEYRRFVQEVVTEGHTSPRCTALALISSVLIPTHWPKKKVVRRPAARLPARGSSWRLTPRAPNHPLSPVGLLLLRRVPGQRPRAAQSRPASPARRQADAVAHRPLPRVARAVSGRRGGAPAAERPCSRPPAARDRTLAGLTSRFFSPPTVVDDRLCALPRRDVRGALCRAHAQGQAAVGR